MANVCTPKVYRRRRLLALIVVTGLVLALITMVGRLGGGPLTASEPRSLGATALVGRTTYVVEPGDTLWVIARRLQPEGDVRPLVAMLSESRRGQPLQVGERINLRR